MGTEKSGAAQTPDVMDRTLRPAAPLLFTVLFLFEFIDLDLRLQDRFFDFRTHRWLIDGGAQLPRLLFYTGPKAVIILVGLSITVLALGPGRWRDRLRIPAGCRRDIWVVVATLATVPALAGLGKSATNGHCPSEIRRYGGDVPYVTLCSPYPVDDRPVRRGRCFPAGHASGGFALISLAGLARTRRGRAAGILVGLASGWAMGLYQILKGAHYLSHPLVTMIMAWIVFLVWRRVLGSGTTAIPSVRSEPGKGIGNP